MPCVAAVNLKGEHIPCQGSDTHKGLAHWNKEHEMIWVGDEGPSHTTNEETD